MWRIEGNNNKKTFVPLFVRKSRESNYSKLLEVVLGYHYPLLE
jgi:hypothetical protein